MKKQVLNFTLYALMVYLTGSTLNPPVAASQPSGGNGTHFFGVIDGQWDKGYADQYPNRHYARAFAANLNVGEPYTVRLIYFLPSGREPRPNIDADMDALIKAVQEGYARDMERHGFGGKTCTFETDATGKAVVHHVNGQFAAAYYEHGTFSKVMEEIHEQFDFSRNIYLVVVDSGYLIDGVAGKAIGGAALINSIEKDLSIYDYLASHELRHTFGLSHDFRVDVRGFTREISKCTAEFLDVHPYFNAPRQSPNLLQNTTIQMFPPSLVSLPNTIRLRFEVSDPDGLHQARLHTPEVTVDVYNSRIGGFLACKRLTGTRSTVEFVTTALPPKTESVSLQMIDVHGNISWSELYPIDVTSLLPPPEVVSIPDANLAAAVRETLGENALTSRTMLELVILDIRGLQITNLTGLEHAISLSKLNLNGNSVSDISALGGLTNLTTLYLGGNSISDLSPLAGLTNLTTLDLGGNSVSDISALGGLTNLTTLHLGWNSISDISALAGLTNLTTLHLQYNLTDISTLAGLTYLTELDLGGNSVSDISALGGLINLTTLNLGGNSASDISPLVANTGLGRGDTVNVRWNPLGYASINTHIPTLQSRGVTVEFDNRTATSLVKISGDQHGSPATPLSHPFVVEVRDEWGGPFEGVTVTFAVTVGEGTLSITQTTTNTDGKAESTLTLGPNLDTNTVEVSAAGVEQPVTFTAVAGEGVTIPDSNLQAAIRTALGVAAGVRIGPSELATLTHLDASGTTIGNLTGLELATNLTTLYLVHNSVSDISALAGLTNLTTLWLGINLVSDISALAGLTNLTDLNLDGNLVSDISALAGLTNLTDLNLDGNLVSDISALAGLTNLTDLNLDGNLVSDISALAGLTNLTDLNLDGNSVSDISALAGLTNLTTLYLRNNSISDISALAGLTNLTELWLGINLVSDISALAGLTNLTRLHLGWDSLSGISDISALVGLTNLTWLRLSGNSISDISPLVANVGLGSGDTVYLEWNPLGYASIHTHIPTLQSRGVTVEFDNQAQPALLKISGDNQTDWPGEILANPFVVEAQDENGSVLAGIPIIFAITVGGGKLSVIRSRTDENGRVESTLTLGPNLGTNTVKVSAAGIRSTVIFHAISAIEYLWVLPAGASWIHVPLKVTTVNGVARSITSVSDLYDALGGASSVNLLTTYDLTTQGWHSYLGSSSRGTIADKELTDDTGIIAVMNDMVSLRLSGDPLGTNGHSSIALHPGPNLVGVPLRDSRIDRVSDLLTLEGIEGNVSAVMVSDNRRFKRVKQAGDAGDISITGGQAFVLIAREGATVAISGEGWANISGAAATPSVAIMGMEVEDVTPVLALRGSIVFPIDVRGKMPWSGQGISSGGERGKMPRLRVIVKNLSTGKAVSTERRSREVPILGRTASAFRTVPGDQKAGYQVTFVDIETGRAAQIGDILEIAVRSPSPLIGVQPLRYTVTAEDVLRSRIELPALIAYEIPSETELLANYPNPFNPETWIPYRLAEDAFVTLTIYDTAGQVVRTLNVGHRIAAVYERRSKAIHWDGRNDLGEGVASGIYFYTLSAGDYSATRKMVILK